MRRTLPGIAAALSEAVRRVNVLYDRVPEPDRPDVTGEAWHDLEREVDMACGAGDCYAALLAIARWEHHAAGILLRAALTGPSLEEVLRDPDQAERLRASVGGEWIEGAA